jgi:putative flavoprotein involved in K+ transport
MNGPLVLVVGAGQAGLAAGYHLKRAGLPFRIVDASDRLGDNWRRRYASLTLFTPRIFSALPGMELRGDPDGYPTRDEFADYLESYAARFKLPVTVAAKVVRLTKTSAEFQATLASGQMIAASHVIVATGGFQTPIVPGLDQGFGPGVIRLTSEDYQRPEQVPSGSVLVVGDGASGRDIAIELAATRTVLLATGKPRKLFPERLLGRSMWWWLKNLGLMNVSAGSFIGRAMRRTDPFPDRDRSLDSLRRAGVKVVPRLIKADGNVATFVDGPKAEIASVIWATGYRDDSSWIDIPGAIGPTGGFLQTQGVSPIRNLYFIGRPWQRNRASALVMGAGSDAAAIVAVLRASVQ